MKPKIKVSDVAKELQTDEFKMKVYRQIEQFVYKYHNHYYPHYKGELKDLVIDIFTNFCKPKKHRNGEVFSELDRVDPAKVGGGNWTGDDAKAIATYTQRYVIARLIDMERTDKREVNASENFNDDKPGLTLDRAYKTGTGDEELNSGAYIESINNSFYDLMDEPQAIKNAIKVLSSDPEQVQRIKYLAKHYKSKLDPEVFNFINRVLRSLGEEEIPLEETPKLKAPKVDLTPILGNEDTVQFYKLQKKPAVKISFPDAESLAQAKDKLPQVEEALDKEGYKFYRTTGNNWYFFQKEQD